MYRPARRRYPERAHPSVEPPALTGICCSGGSTRSYAATLGHLRGLTETGLISRVGYLSAVSGGAWAAVPYTYYAGDLTADKDLLGAHREPEHLSLDRLDRLDPRSLWHAATLDFGKALAAAQHAGVPSERVWIRAVAQTFLAPFGLFDAAHPAGFTLNARTEREIRERNPTLDGVELQTTWGRSHRPYLLVHSTLNWPPDEPDVVRSERVGFEYSPLGVGCPAIHTWKSAGGSLTTVGGGFVEPFAFGGAPPENGIEADVAEVSRPDHVFSLADAIGASSAFSTADRDLRRYPHALCWPVGCSDDGERVASRHVFTDGGDLENYGLIALLCRGVRALVVFVNSFWPLALDYDPTPWPEDLDVVAPSRRRLDPFLAPLFGAPSARFPNNHVFEAADYPALVTALQSAKRRGGTVVAARTHRVQTNEWWSLEGGHDVTVCWVYNDQVEQWTDRLPDSLKTMVREGQMAGTGPFSHFPHYLTRGQNPGALIRLTPRQVNLLADLSSWNVVANHDTLRDVLG